MVSLFMKVFYIFNINMALSETHTSAFPVGQVVFAIRNVSFLGIYINFCHCID